MRAASRVALRCQANVEKHRAAWLAHTEEAKKLIGRSRKMHREADELAKKSARFNRTAPVIDWGKAATAQSAA